MNKHLTAVLLSACLSSSAWADTYFFGVDNVNATIFDNDYNGIQNSQTLPAVPGTITRVNVSLNLLSGFNGDYYATLLHNGTRAVLLDRVGRSSTSEVGYADHGFGLDAATNAFVLSDEASQDIHWYRTLSYTLNGASQLTGVWQPDGRSVLPLESRSLFDGAARPNMLSVFNGLDATGEWTLFLADVSGGGEGTLVSWGLEITTVPEPACLSLATLGLGALWLIARRRA